MRKGFFGKVAVIAMMASAVTFTSCDDDDDAKFVPSFPQAAQTFTDAENCSVSFTANDVWTLSSDASWAVFENGSTTTQGEAGEQNIAVVVTLSRENAGKTANITLAYPNAPETSMVIATISQSPWVSEVKLVDAEAISVGYAGATIKITSNVECAAKELPSFLTFNGRNTLEIKVGENEIEIAFDENEIETQAPDKTWNGKIEFFEENGEAAVGAIDINYTGMAQGEMLIDIIAPYNWSVDLKSQEERYYREMMGMKMQVYAEGIPFNVYAGEDIVFLHGVLGGNKYWIEEVNEETQFGVEKTETGYQFFVWSNVQDNSGELYAIPASVYEKMNKDELTNGVEAGYIEDKYFVLNWAMAASGEVSFKDGLTYEDIAFEMNPDLGMEIGMVMANHSVIVNIPNFNPEDIENMLVSVTLMDINTYTEENLVASGKVEPMEDGFIISTDNTMSDKFITIMMGDNTYFIYVYSFE